MTSVSGEKVPLALTRFQIEVAQLFFSLPAAQGFLLAGGAALVAQHLTSRPTHDLDFFTQVGATSVPDARDAIENAARERGWTIERVRDEAIFCRLIVHGNDDLLVDLALDSPPEHPATASLLGPTFAPQERLLQRLYARDDGWVLKGAAALLAREVSVRATRDVDLYRRAGLVEAEAALREALALDLGTDALLNAHSPTPA